MYCGECGSNIEEKQIFCMKCGNDLTKQDQAPAKGGKIENSPKQQNIPPPSQSQYNPPSSQNNPNYSHGGYVTPSTYSPGGVMSMYEPPQRSFINWFFISLITCGIGFYIYIFYNFEDVRKLEQRSLLKRNQSMFITNTTDPAIGLILYFVCSPISIYLKYSNLQKFLFMNNMPHFANQAKSGEYIIGIYALTIILVFFSFVMPIIFLVIIFIGIYLLILENDWQDLLNKANIYTMQN
ncbi:MAG: hypothetical protein OEZ01_16970 [Candidatus Heimdallarchaeota archaeon]|nr:hypothetical protein [Candidatus Heimdallarchaeota archaeon]